MTAYPANPKVLQWARTDRHLSVEEAAERLSLSTADLVRIEAGTSPVTIGFLRAMANKYDVAFSSLLMPEPPPTISRPLPDHRVREGKVPILGFSISVILEEVNDALDFFVDLQQADPDVLPQAKLNSATLQDSAKDIARRERELLGVGIGRQLGWVSASEAFRTWREAIENKGIFVYQFKMRDGNISGISIWDERKIPAIIINSDEIFNEAKIFTLLHEYGHILLRQGGISDENRRAPIETWCNNFAAYLAMPPIQFMREANFTSNDNPREWTSTEITHLAGRFKVSKYATLIHLEQLKMAPSGFVDEFTKGWSVVSPPRKGGGRSTYPERRVNRFGGRHVNAILGALSKKLIDEVDAAELLDTAPRHFDSLGQEVEERSAAYGPRS